MKRVLLINLYSLLIKFCLSLDIKSTSHLVYVALESNLVIQGFIYEFIISLSPYHYKVTALKEFLKRLIYVG